MLHGRRGCRARARARGKSSTANQASFVLSEGCLEDPRVPYPYPLSRAICEDIPPVARFSFVGLYLGAEGRGGETGPPRRTRVFFGRAYPFNVRVPRSASLGLTLASFARTVSIILEIYRVPARIKELGFPLAATAAPPPGVRKAEGQSAIARAVLCM